MSFAAVSFFDMLLHSDNDEWDELERTQASVTTVFSAMQDDPTRFADLQRAKVVMGLGQPLTRDVTDEQIERIFNAIDSLAPSKQKLILLASLRLMPDGPYHDRLKKLLDDCLKAMN